MFGRFLASRPPDILLRLLLAAVSFVVLFFPYNESGSQGPVHAARPRPYRPRDSRRRRPHRRRRPILAALAVGVVRHNRVNEPPSAVQVDETAVDRSDARELIAEAKRELG